MKIVLLLQSLFIIAVSSKKPKKPQKWDFPDPKPKYDNPNFVKDRHKDEISKPEMPDNWVDRFRQPFSPSFMDYCDPYHCNDYHKTACGLNRKTMRFKWFQSGCHIILNNKCASYRGNLKYDMVDTKFCMIYVMFLRDGCPAYCEDVLDPVCAISADNEPTIFTNNCAYEKENCNGIPEYERVDMAICDYYIRHGRFKIKNQVNE